MANWGSQLAAERLGPLMQATVLTPATAVQLAASITFLLSDNGTNDNGAILAGTGRRCRGSGTQREYWPSGGPEVVRVSVVAGIPIGVGGRRCRCG